jgi:hypothetical protein
MKLFTNVDQVISAMQSEIPKVSDAVLDALSDHIQKEVKRDYETRVQQLGPIIHPVTKQVLSEMEPREISKYVERFVEGYRAVTYVAEQADKEGRRQELFGGKPWQAIRGKMQNIDYVNGILPGLGLHGIKAKPVA